jgi:DHA2 family multidrug resistance protein
MALALPAAGRPASYPWFIAVAAVIPTFMAVQDPAIVTVGLRYIAGGLSAAPSDAEWVLTGYLAACAIILPISGWLSAHLGRRNYLLFAITGFIIASGLCGLATSVEQLILFRVLQGLVGGGLLACSQAVLLDSFPIERQGAAMTLFALAIVLALILGPMLGGWLVTYHNWRWIFYINIPVGGLGLGSCYFLLKDPDYLVKERAELRSRPLHFDYPGLGLLILTVCSWEILLSQGQDWNWLGDPFWRVQALAIPFVLGLSLFIYREMRIGNPLVDLRPLRERHFLICCVLAFGGCGVLYGSDSLLAYQRQFLFGSAAVGSGSVPWDVSSILLMVAVGALLVGRLDARWLIAVGLLMTGSASFWLTYMRPASSPWQAVWVGIALSSGLWLLFVPILVAAYLYIPRQLRGPAVGILSLVAIEGGNFGAALARALLELRTRLHLERLGESIDAFKTAGGFPFMRDLAGSEQTAQEVFGELRRQQAEALACFDVFWVFAVLSFVLIFFVPFMKHSVAAKGDPSLPG